MKYLLPILQFGLLALAVIFVGLQFANLYSVQVRNQAIDGCYAQSYYRTEYKQDNKTITTSETQKYIFDKCLVDKNITLSN